MFNIYTDKCPILREWADSDAPVFIDFGEGPSIWWFLPRRTDGSRDFVAAFARTDFIAYHLGGKDQKIQEFEEFLKDFSKLFSNYKSTLLPRSPNPSAPQFENSYPIKSFIYWRTKILEADQLTVLEKVGKALAKYKSRTKTLGIKEALTEDQLISLRKFYSDKLKLFKEAG